MLSDLTFPVTAKKIGASSVALSRPKVYYLKSSDLLRIEADSVRGNAVLTVKEDGKSKQKKVELYESPNEFIGAQAQSQGATANPYAAFNYAVLLPTSSATAADQNVAQKYFNEISSVNGGTVRLPDPFVKRLVILQNTTTGPVTVRARGTTSPINGSTAGFTLAAGARKHFLAPTAATAGTTAGWQTAIDA